MLCANLIDGEEDFNKKATYYVNKSLQKLRIHWLILLQATKLYDYERGNIESPNCHELACMDIRALHISGVCTSECSLLFIFLKFRRWRML
jgi:Peptidase M76 family